jgi:glutaredoxin
MFCARVKEFLHKQNIEFADRDITSDESALAELEKLGVMTTPVTVVDGQIVVGFNPQKIEELLR